jgi:hypothetical protein
MTSITRSSITSRSNRYGIVPFRERCAHAECIVFDANSAFRSLALIARNTCAATIRDIRVQAKGQPIELGANAAVLTSTIRLRP